MPDLSFATATLTGGDFSGTNLVHGYLVTAQMADGTFANADLGGADLTAADLAGVQTMRHRLQADKP
jgi:uncharacterized protein YjbI with pentapeptide repeats